MMISNFSKFMESIYEKEGYYSKHEWDKGGETLFGISRVYNPDWTGWKIWDCIAVNSVPPRDKAYMLLDEHVRNLYKTKYWDEVRADELPSGIDLFTADCCVNPGPNFIKRALQNASGAFPDGIIGPKTLAKVNGGNHERILGELHDLRGVYYAMNTHPKTREKAIKGWTRRNREVYEESLRLMHENNL